MIIFTNEEKEMIARLAKQVEIDVPPFDEEWSNDIVLAISAAARDFELAYGLDENYCPTKEGLVAISVGDKLEMA